MQLSMFEPADESQCSHPNLSGLSGYRYGCRCERCCEAKSRWRHPTNCCAQDGCDAPREKHRRYCEDHRPRPNVTERIVAIAACELCGTAHRWYESTLTTNIRPELRDLYRRTCGNCRQPYISAIRHHRLDTTQALRLLTAHSCELCGERFPIGDKGRRKNAIDHNHACCPGPHSCGGCVRGVLCNRCNHTIASIEQLITVGLDRVLAYLGHDD